MNKWILSSFLVLLSGTVLASDLKVTVGPNPVMALPVDLITCKDMNQFVAKPAVDIGHVSVRWMGQKSYRMSYIELKMNDSRLDGQTYSCVIGGSELNAVLPALYEGVHAGDQTVHQAQCGIRCGAIPFKGLSAPATYQASLKFHGVEFDQTGMGTHIVTEVPLTIDKSF